MCSHYCRGETHFLVPVLFVQKRLCGNVLCTYSTNPAHGVVPRVRYADRQGIAGLEVVGGIEIVILTSLRVADKV